MNSNEWDPNDDVEPDYEDAEVAERRRWLDQWAKEDAPLIEAERARRKAYANGFTDAHEEAIRKHVSKALADEWLEWLLPGNAETDDDLDIHKEWLRHNAEYLMRCAANGEENRYVTEDRRRDAAIARRKSPPKGRIKHCGIEPCADKEVAVSMYHDDDFKRSVMAGVMMRMIQENDVSAEDDEYADYYHGPRRATKINAVGRALICSTAWLDPEDVRLKTEEMADKFAAFAPSMGGLR